MREVMNWYKLSTMILIQEDFKLAFSGLKEDNELSIEFISMS